MWFDYKQEILPIKINEGCVECFGKRVISLLDAIFVRCEIKIANGEEITGLARYFYDVLVDKHSLQDNT